MLSSSAVGETLDTMKFVRGLFTSEFWTTVGGAALPWAVDGLPATWKATLSTVAAAVYTLSRGLAKLGFKGDAPGTPESKR
jgi:hypothetical protein